MHNERESDLVHLSQWKQPAGSVSVSVVVGGSPPSSLVSSSVVVGDSRCFQNRLGPQPMSPQSECALLRARRGIDGCLCGAAIKVMQIIAPHIPRCSPSPSLCRCF